MLSGARLNEELALRFRKWLLVQDYAIPTRLGGNKVVRSFTAFMKSTPVTESTHFDIREYLVTRARQHMSSRTLRNDLYNLRIYFDFLNMGGLVRAVAPRFVRLRTRPALPLHLTESQVRKVIAAAKDKFERAIVETLYGSGCRHGELRLMKVEDLDLAARRVRVSGKTGPRFVIFGKRAARALRAYLGSRRTGYLFIEKRRMQHLTPHQTKSGGWSLYWKQYDSDGNFVRQNYHYISAYRRLNRSAALAEFSKLAPAWSLKRAVGRRPLSKNYINLMMRGIALRSGVHVTPYKLRHSYATHMLDRGANLRVLQELMGHASITSTQIYTHVSKRNLANTFDRCHPRA